MATPTEITTGEALRVEREEAHLTQDQIASAMRSTQQYVSTIEGKATVRPATAKRYRDAVSVYTSGERAAS